MSIQTGDHDVDQVLAGLQQGLAELRRLWRQARSMLDRWRQGRTSVEDLLNRRNWDRGLDQALPRQEDQGQQAELNALQEYERSLATRIREQQERIDELQRQRDQSLNNDRDRDGIDDRVENRTDLDRDGIDDNVEESEQTAAEIEDDHDRDGDGKDDAVEHRQEEQAEADADREKRDQERQAREDEESGVDADTAVGAAAGTAVVAEAVDGELDKQNEARDADAPQADNEQGVEANANDTGRDQAADQAINSGQQAAAEVENAAPGVDQQTGAEVENAAPGVDQQSGAEVENAGVDPSRAADNQLAAEQGSSPSVTDSADVGQDGPQTHIEGSEAEENTAYEVGEGESVRLHYGEGSRQDSLGQDMGGAGQDSEAANGESINVGDISGNNQTFVVDQNGVHQGVQDGDRTVAQAGQEAEQGRQPQETMEQPAFPTAGDQAAANQVAQQTEQGGQNEQGGQGAQRADQVAARDAQEQPVLDELREGNAENRAKNPPGRAQNEMSPDEIGQQRHQVEAGRPSAAGAPGFDAGELAKAGSSDGQREYADRARNQGSRDRGNDGRGMGD